MCALGVKEADIKPLCPSAGLFIYKLHPLFSGFGEGNAGIGSSKSDMMNPLASLLQELGNGTIFACRLKQFEFSFSNFKESRTYLLVGYFFYVIALEPQSFFKKRKSFLDTLNGYTQVFDM